MSELRSTPRPTPDSTYVLANRTTVLWHAQWPSSSLSLVTLNPAIPFSDHVRIHRRQRTPHPIPSRARHRPRSRRHAGLHRCVRAEHERVSALLEEYVYSLLSPFLRGFTPSVWAFSAAWLRGVVGAYYTVGNKRSERKELARRAALIQQGESALGERGVELEVLGETFNNDTLRRWTWGGVQAF